MFKMNAFFRKAFLSTIKFEHIYCLRSLINKNIVPEMANDKGNKYANCFCFVLKQVQCEDIREARHY